MLLRCFTFFFSCCIFEMQHLWCVLYTYRTFQLRSDRALNNYMWLVATISDRAVIEFLAGEWQYPIYYLTLSEDTQEVLIEAWLVTNNLSLSDSQTKRLGVHSWVSGLLCVSSTSLGGRDSDLPKVIKLERPSKTLNPDLLGLCQTL